MTNKQNKEIQNLLVWIHDCKNVDWAPVTDEDVKKFFEWSERGLHKELASIPTYLTNASGRTGFHALMWAKKWRERTRDPKNDLQNEHEKRELG